MRKYSKYAEDQLDVSETLQITELHTFAFGSDTIYVFQLEVEEKVNTIKIKKIKSM